MSTKAKLRAEFRIAFPHCWVKPGEDFDGSTARVLWSGEGSEIVMPADKYGPEYLAPAFDMYATGDDYIFGVHKSLNDWAESRGYYWEAYDGGTYFLYLS